VSKEKERGPDNLLLKERGVRPIPAKKTFKRENPLRRKPLYGVLYREMKGLHSERYSKKTYGGNYARVNLKKLPVRHGGITMAGNGKKRSAISQIEKNPEQKERPLTW